jgi:hypothetical protein
MKMRWKLFQLKCVIFCVGIIVSDASDATRRHRREGDAKEVVKKKKREDICVYGYCLDHNYNSMELPSKVQATHVRMNLEVSVKSSPVKLIQVKSSQFDASQVKLSQVDFSQVQHRCCMLPHLPEWMCRQGK